MVRARTERRASRFEHAARSVRSVLGRSTRSPDGVSLSALALARRGILSSLLFDSNTLHGHGEVGRTHTCICADSSFQAIDPSLCHTMDCRPPAGSPKMRDAAHPNFLSRIPKFPVHTRLRPCARRRVGRG